jgi:hypothetical protein
MGTFGLTVSALESRVAANNGPEANTHSKRGSRVGTVGRDLEGYVGKETISRKPGRLTNMVGSGPAGNGSGATLTRDGMRVDNSSVAYWLGHIGSWGGPSDRTNGDMFLRG